MKPLLALAVTVLSLQSCVDLDAPTEPEIEAIARPQVWTTGTNSASFGDGLMFDELDSAGQPSRNGLRILRAYLPRNRRRIPVTIRVRRHHLEAVELDPPHTTYSGSALVNAVIELWHETKGTYELHITNYYPYDLTFWAGSLEFVPFYEMKARMITGYSPEAGQTESASGSPAPGGPAPVGGSLPAGGAGNELDANPGTVTVIVPPTNELRNVCPINATTQDPVWRNAGQSALVFQGDYYNPVQKTVYSVPDERPMDSDTRFNVACAGTAPAKMHLTRHTRAGSYSEVSSDRYPTTVGQRQAMLKMFTADYCGTGTSYTVDGYPLTYSDGRTKFARWSEGIELEALWTSTGAVCMNTPRRGIKVAAAIAAECGALPPCKVDDAKLFASEKLMFPSLKPFLPSYHVASKRLPR